IGNSLDRVESCTDEPCPYARSVDLIAHHFQRAPIGYCIARWKTARKGLRKSRAAYCCRGNPGELEILFLVTDYCENHFDTFLAGCGKSVFDPRRLDPRRILMIVVMLTLRRNRV